MISKNESESNNGIKAVLRADGWKINKGVPTERIVEIELTAPAAHGSSESPPLNLGLVIDRSGSMSGGKLEQAKLAVEEIIDLLRAQDSLSIVTFDDQVRVLAETDSTGPLTHTELKQMVRGVYPGGSTNLGGGWLQGCQNVARRQSRDKVNRTLLLSDGQANVGIVDANELGQHASEIFERGVSTSTFGIGLGFNEHLMERIANQGGGNFYYIGHDQQIPELLMQEFSDLSSVTLKDTLIGITIPAGTKAELFGEWRVKQKEDLLTISLSDLPANRTVNLFLRLLISPAEENYDMTVTIAGIGESGETLRSLNVLHLTRASDEEVNRQPIDLDLLTRFSSVAIGQISNEALKLERAGRRDEARQLMDRAMNKYSQHMPQVTRDRYDGLRLHISEGLEENMRKTMNYDSYMLKRHRHVEQSRDPDQDKNKDNS